MKHIAAISEHIDGLSAAKRLAEQQLDAAVGTLGVAHTQLHKASEHVDQLTDGASKGALVDMAAYMQEAREVVAEAMLALSRLRPNLLTSQNAPALIADARAGMQAKRLAKWEADALKEAVVSALAGQEPAP